jgi:hypothetical protein
MIDEREATIFRCRGCGLDKPATEFSLKPKSPTGYHYLCNPCRNARRREVYDQSPVVNQERELRELRRLANIKIWANKQLDMAVRKGIVICPEACEICGVVPKRKDGRRLDGHHHRGHDRPLDVQWLCGKCHVAADRNAAGELNGRAKLNRAAVLAIRESAESSRVLAERYGVHPTTIQGVRNGSKWVSV